LMKSTDIFRSPSFFKGMARVVNIFGGLDAYKYTDDPDSELINRDWHSVGNDLQEEINTYERKSNYQIR